MKTLCIPCGLLVLCAVLALPAAARLAAHQPGRAFAWRWPGHWPWGSQRQQVLAWLRAWGPFTQPPPGQLPARFAVAQPAAGNFRPATQRGY